MPDSATTYKDPYGHSEQQCVKGDGIGQKPQAVNHAGTRDREKEEDGIRDKKTQNHQTREGRDEPQRETQYQKRGNNESDPWKQSRIPIKYVKGNKGENAEGSLKHLRIHSRIPGIRNPGQCRKDKNRGQKKTEGKR